MFHVKRPTGSVNVNRIFADSEADRPLARRWRGWRLLPHTELPKDHVQDFLDIEPPREPPEARERVT
jgi:hypothetical protein